MYHSILHDINTAMGTIIYKYDLKREMGYMMKTLGT